jgi:hypothetical protein
MSEHRDTIRGQQSATWTLYNALYHYLGWPNTDTAWLAPFVKAWTRNNDGLYIAPVIIDFPVNVSVYWTYERQQDFAAHLKQCIDGWWQIDFSTAGQGYIRATLMVHHVEQHVHTGLDGTKHYETRRYPPNDLLITELPQRQPSLLVSIIKGVLFDGWTRPERAGALPAEEAPDSPIGMDDRSSSNGHRRIQNQLGMRDHGAGYLAVFNRYHSFNGGLGK